MKAKNLIKGLVLAACTAMSSASFACLIVDTVNLGNTKLSNGQTKSWSHNLNDDGFVLGSALSGLLTIDLKDDNDNSFERAGITVELDLNLVDLFLGGNDDGSVSNIFSQTFQYDTNLSFTSLLSLNSD